MTRERPSLAETRSVTIALSDRVYAGLIEHGRKAGYTPSLMAKLLFEAAWAARVGKSVDDPVLEACVGRSLDRRPEAVPATAVEPRIVREAVAVPVPVLIPVPIAVPLPIRAEPLAVHITGNQPITEEASSHLATLIGAAVAKFSDVPSVAVPGFKEPLPGWSASQATFARLVCREEGASFAEVKEALAPAYQRKDALWVLISGVRKKLALLGVHFEPVGVWGWRVVAASRPAADDFLRRAA